MTKTLVEDFRTAIISMAVLTVLCGLLYPLVITGVGQGLFNRQANGSLIKQDGEVVGSSLVGQNFADAKYFHPRPSAAGADGYDGGSSSGSNLGPSSQALVDRIKDGLAAVRDENGLASDVLIPVDAVTTSASGLDPHISPAYADLQVARVAKERRMSQDDVRALVKKYTDGSLLYVVGEPRVNVLRLNLALDNHNK